MKAFLNNREMVEIIDPKVTIDMECLPLMVKIKKENGDERFEHGVSLKIIKPLVITTTEPYGMFSFGKDVNYIVPIEGYTGMKDIPENVCASMYIHGVLQSRAEFDIPEFLEGTYPLVDGIYEGVFLLPGKNNDIEKVPCKLYKWKSSNRELGLIVSNDDSSGIADAENKFNQKVLHL